MEYREGLIIGSACEAGELYRAFLDNKNMSDITRMASFYDFLEIQPLGNNNFLIEQGRVSSLDQIKQINKKIVNLAKYLNKPVVATGDVHFIDPDDSKYRAIIMAGQGFTDADNQAPLYFRTTEEMLKEFDYLGEQLAYEVVVKNTNIVADMIENIRPVPKEKCPPEIPGAQEELVDIVTKRAHEIYGESLPEVVETRMNRELEPIIKHGFAVMYMLAQKLVLKSNSDGYLVGSRGSVGSSFVAFLAGITEVNALAPHYVCPNCKNSEFDFSRKYGCGADMPDKQCPVCKTMYKKDGFEIPFETFLGFDGDKEPDIDLNFSGEYQPRAHKYTEVLCGEGYVFRAGTIGTLASKTAFGYVNKYLEERSIKAHKAEIELLVEGCTGARRTTGQHPGGIIVVPRSKEIYDFCPISHPADDPNSDIITTHFDYHSIDQNLLKLDILGHDDPTVIRMLEDITGIDAKKIPLDDKSTMSIFTTDEALKIKPNDVTKGSGTLAIPEFGTSFVRGMLKDTQPTMFAELVRISGLSHGTDVWLNNAQELIQKNITTLSEAICTRDDIMEYLISTKMDKKLSFIIMESVRKGKGLKPEWIEEMKKCDVPQWYIDSCLKIKYMFPKAHAVAYVTMAFRIAWFKVNHPLAFYAAYFTIRADAFDAKEMIYGPEIAYKKLRDIEKMPKTTQKDDDMHTILEVVYEMYMRGFEFLPIDLYNSDASKFLIVDGKLLPPLSSLQGVGENAAKAICQARLNGQFTSMEDIKERAGVSKTVIETLKDQGILGDMPESSQLSFFDTMFN